MQPRLQSLCDDGGSTEKPTFDPNNCSIWITATIGFEGQCGVDLFSINVVTVEYLMSCEKPSWGRNLLIVKYFGWEEIEESINVLLSGISTNSWDEASKILTSYMNWEFDGM